MKAELENRFEFHPADNAAKRNLHGQVRAAARTFAEELDILLPESREKSLAFTAVEQAMMWGSAALARHWQPKS